MKEVKFNNRQNPAHQVGDRTIWESRSPAVVVAIFGTHKDDLYVLVEKRSLTMMDGPGKWCLVCGYMDWDETGNEAVIRETYEETGLYLPDFEKNLLYDNQKQPFYVQTDPAENRQNVALRYVHLYDFPEGLPDLTGYQNLEIEALEWMPLQELELGKILSDRIKTRDWGFEHEKIINLAVGHLVMHTDIDPRAI